MTDMPSVLIIGGGVAGLAAAVELVSAGWRVTVLEQRSFCGGRAYAFREPVTGATIDNGQHLFMGCYRATFDYLQKIGAADGVTIETKLRVPLIDAAGVSATLDCPGWPPPWHLLAGLWRLRGFSKRSLWQLMWKGSPLLCKEGKGEVERDLPHLASLDTAFAARLHVRKVCHPPQADVSPFAPPYKGEESSIDHLSISDLLDRLGQDARAREVFWTPLVLAVCNETPERASAATLLAVMREAFAQKNTPMGLAFPQRNLSALLVRPAIALLRAKQGVVREAATVEAILQRDDGITGVRLRGGEILHADAYISALPPRPLHTVLSADGGALPTGWDRLREWWGVPIISVHLWFDRPVMDQPMVGFIGSRFHWAFNKSAVSRQSSVVGNQEVTDDRRPATDDRSYCIALVASAAREEATWPRERVIAEATQAVRQYLPAARDATILHTQVTKELEATISIAPGTAAMRLPTQTPWPNFFLAGDWTDTGLPATIESAVRSGQAAAAGVQCTANALK